MSIVNSVRFWIRTVFDTALIVPRRLRSIDQQLKVITQMKDGVFSFIYRDVDIRLALPDVCRDSIQTNILDAGTFWELSSLECIQRYIKPGSIVADCGSNIGNHVVYFAKICRAAKVYAFEPQRHCFDLIKQQLKLNGLEVVVEPLHVALGDKVGRMNLADFELGNLGGTSFTYDDDGSVPAITLDSLSIQRLDFMKIDVEGAQLALLEGARETLRRCSPVIWVELLGAGAHDYEVERRRPQKLLSELGYILVEKLSEDDFVYAKHD